MAWPPFVTWAEGLSTETVSEDLFLAKNRTKFECNPTSFFFGLHLIVGQKIMLNLSEDFFFGLHLSLSRKTDLVLGWNIFILVFIILKSSEFRVPPPPPLSKILLALLCMDAGNTSLCHWKTFGSKSRPSILAFHLADSRLSEIVINTNLLMSTAE